MQFYLAFKLFLIPYFFLQEGIHNQMVMLNNNLLPRNHFDILYPVSLTAANKNVIDNCFCMTQCVHYKMANFSPKIDVYQFHTFPKCPLHQSNHSADQSHDLNQLHQKHKLPTSSQNSLFSTDDLPTCGQ